MKLFVRNIANTLCISAIIIPFSKNMCNIYRTCNAHKYIYPHKSIVPWYYDPALRGKIIPESLRTEQFS